MSYTVWFHPDAEAEVNEATIFLDLESPGLGDAFIDDLEHALGVIRHHPQIARIIRGRARSKVFRRFPYSIIYSVV